jgi:hypothetical protein
MRWRVRVISVIPATWSRLMLMLRGHGLGAVAGVAGAGVFGVGGVADLLRG